MSRLAAPDAGPSRSRRQPPFRDHTSDSLLGRTTTLLPPVLVLAVALGYLSVVLWSGDDLAHLVLSSWPPIGYVALVCIQAVALLRRERVLAAAFAVTVGADLTILATTGAELGIGALAVIFAAYTVARRKTRTRGAVLLGSGAAATTAATVIAMSVAGTTIAIVISTAVARIGLLYVLPAVIAEYTRGRQRLRVALQAQQRLAEVERLAQAERARHAERAALARELHDIAGHHLSGIIFGAQAAKALLHSDPDRAAGLLQTVQDGARVTLVDLRRTVGLLRDEDGTTDGQPAPVPSADRIDHLVLTARDRGQNVSLAVAGQPRPLGPLADTAAYRMVQESLSNAAQHAPGAESRVLVTWDEEHLIIVVQNDSAPAASRPPRNTRPFPSASGGYGLTGMAERAELIGADLRTGARGDGGWTNTLTIPVSVDTP